MPLSAQTALPQHATTMAGCLARAVEDLAAYLSPPSGVGSGRLSEADQVSIIRHVYSALGGLADALDALADNADPAGISPQSPLGMNDAAQRMRELLPLLQSLEIGVTADAFAAGAPLP